MAKLSIYCLGPPHLELDGAPAALDRNKAVGLLVYLALERGSHRRESLAALFWPDYDHERASAYLRRTLWSIRDSLGEGWVAADRELVELVRSPDIFVDVWQFQAALAECSQHGHPAQDVCERCIDPLQRAVALYRGDFLAGFSLRDSASFDDWQFFQSEELKNALAGALQRLAQAYSLHADFTQAVLASRRWLALDLLNEAAHRALMQAYAQAGQRNAALRQYQDCRRILADELGVEPQPETTRLFESIKSSRGSAPEIAPLSEQGLKPAGQPVRPRHSNLPLSSTPFVGRIKELAEIQQLIRNPECRLLTLLGPGGIGKTRLAIAAAGQNLELFADGVAFIALAPADSPESIFSGIASSLGLQFRSKQIGGDAPESQKVQLREYLRNRNIALVLDNFEHLISGAALLSEILTYSPGLMLLVTSRERLQLAEEWVFAVGGMSYPSDGSSESMESYSAVQLFLQHARRARADFALTPADQPSIVRICQLLEGAPLAIELAAVWVKMLSPGEIAAEIERSLDFLTASLHGLPQRHQSLRAVFEHSWNLLSAQEQETLMRLSVFRGPFRREAAAAIMLAEQTQGAALLLGLAALIDKSLLRRVEGAGQEVRFAMHELVRQYAAEKLGRAPQRAEATRDAHASYYAAWLERMRDEMRGARQIQALNQVEAEIGDVRAAWSWLVERADFKTLRKAVDGLFRFYDIRSRHQDILDDFRPAIEALERHESEAVPPRSHHGRVGALTALLLAYSSSALFTLTQGDSSLGNQYYGRSLELARGLEEGDQARVYTLLNFGNSWLPPGAVEDLYQHSLQFFQRSGDRWWVAMSMLAYASFIQFTLVDLPQARQIYTGSLALFREAGDRVGMVLALNPLATLSYVLGEYAEVKRLSYASLELCRALGDRWRVATVLLSLGQACVALGEYAQAKEVYHESLELVRQLGNRRVEARFLACLGYVHYLEQEYALARPLFQEAADLSQQIDDRRELGMSYMNLGNIASASGDLLEAQRCYQAAIDLLKDIPYARWEYSICLKRMGNLQASRGATAQARELYRQALAISLQLQRVPEMLDNLLGMAELLIQENQPEQAVELLAMALAQGEAAQDVLLRAEKLFTELENKLSPASFSQAAAKGRGRRVEDVAQLFSEA